MHFLRLLIFILTAFSSSSYARQEPQSLCYLNVTLIADTAYFIEKAFNQWKSDSTTPSQFFCSESEISFPVQISLTGRGLAYPFSNNSKIRLSLAVPQTDISFILERNLEVSLTQKRLVVENFPDHNHLENAEIHIENNLSEDEMKSITKSVITIKQITETK